MKILSRRLGTMLAATVAVVGITTALSPPAQADEADYHVASYDPLTGITTGSAFFSSFYEEFTLWDEADDNHGVVLHINISNDGGATYRRWMNLYNGGGDNSYKIWNFDAEFTEDRALAFRVCRQDGINQESFHCSVWEKARA